MQRTEAIPDETLMLVASAVCNGMFTQDADGLMLSHPLHTRIKLIEIFNKVLVNVDALSKLRGIGVTLDAIADLRNLLDASVVRQDRLLAVEGIKTPTLQELDAGICAPIMELPPPMQKTPAQPPRGPKQFAHMYFSPAHKRQMPQASLASYILQNSA